MKITILIICFLIPAQWLLCQQPGRTATILYQNGHTILHGNNTPISEILDELAVRYGYQIKYLLTGNERFNGYLDLGHPIMDIIEIIRKGYDLKYTKENNIITLFPDTRSDLITVDIMEKWQDTALFVNSENVCKALDYIGKLKKIHIIYDFKKTTPLSFYGYLRFSCQMQEPMAMICHQLSLRYTFVNDTLRVNNKHYYADRAALFKGKKRKIEGMED